MTKRVQRLRHIGSEAATFIGLDGEITVDTTNKKAIVHDGATAGGFPVAREDLENVAAATTSVAGKMSAADKTKLDGIEAGATGDLTGAEVKTLYEAEADTNAFTDADQTYVQTTSPAKDVTHDAHVANTSNPHGVTASQIGVDPGAEVNPAPAPASEIVTGTETAERVVTPDELKSAIDTLSENIINGLVTTKGDLLVRNASEIARLAVGSPREILRVNDAGDDVAYTPGIVLATPVSVSGTEQDFTGLPAGIRRLTVMFEGVSLSDGSELLLQLGDSGGFVNTGYVSRAVSIDASITSALSSTTGFLLNDSGGGSTQWTGNVTINLYDPATYKWIMTSILGEEGSHINPSWGRIALSDVLDRFRVTSTTGTATFDSGTINYAIE